MADVATKRCTKRGEKKPLTEFNRQWKACGGRAVACRKCTTLRKRQAAMIAADPSADAASARPGTSMTGPGGYRDGDFAEVGPDGAEVHDDGEIWAQTTLVADEGLTAEHTEEVGLSRVRRYVTDGLRFAPVDPPFLDLRNTIILAAFNATGNENVTTLWEVFASRGMGWSATTSGLDDIAPSPAFDLPPAATTGDASSVGQSTATLKRADRHERSADLIPVRDRRDHEQSNHYTG
jgi:hypothetical protein